MQKLLALLCSLLLLLTLTACGPWDDAVALIDGWTNPPEPTAAPAEPTPTAEPTPDDTPAIDALGVVVSGTFPGIPDRSIAGWLEAYCPGGDWTSTEDSVDYWATAPYYGKMVELHFAFSVDTAAKTFALENCAVSKYTYTVDELPELAEQLTKSAAAMAEQTEP